MLALPIAFFLSVQRWHADGADYRMGGGGAEGLQPIRIMFRPPDQVGRTYLGMGMDGSEIWVRLTTPSYILFPRGAGRHNVASSKTLFAMH